MKLVIKVITAFTFLILFTMSTQADDVVRIEVGKDYKNYSNSDLRRRVWRLENAVEQLQRRIYDLESEKDKPEKPKPVEDPDKWFCKISAMGREFVGTGLTKAKAKLKTIENCKSETNGDSYFCKDPKCEE